MSRELRQALEDAEDRLPKAKQELAAPPDAAFLALQSELVTALEPLRARKLEVERKRDAAEAGALAAERALEAHAIDRRATFSRNQVGPWYVMVPAFVGLGFLIVWSFGGLFSLPTPLGVAVSTAIPFAFGTYLSLRVMPR